MHNALALNMCVLCQFYYNLDFLESDCNQVVFFYTDLKHSFEKKKVWKENAFQIALLKACIIDIN